MFQNLKSAIVKLLAKTKLPSSSERDQMAYELSKSFTQLDREKYTRLVIDEVIDDLKRRVDRERI